MKTLQKPSRTKTDLGRLVDALGTLKISKDAITEEFESGRSILLLSGETDVSGAKFRATVTEIESSRTDMEKLEKWLLKHGKKIEDFKVSSTSSRLLLKPI